MSEDVRIRPPQTIYVKVATFLLADLFEWSVPLNVRIEKQHDDTYEMIFKEPDE